MPQHAGQRSGGFELRTLIEIAVAYSVVIGKCYYDTNGDGDCIKGECPVCHPEQVSA